MITRNHARPFAVCSSLGLLLGAVALEVAASDGYNCGTPYTLPSDLANPPTQASQKDADSFAWQSFLALSAASSTPAWSSWHSTVDLIECESGKTPSGGTCTSDGYYYPAACTSIANYTQYRVSDQVSKVNDSFLEATTQGLSHDPVIASNATFLRYQIVISPATYNWIVSQGLQKESTLDQYQKNGTPIVFPCSRSATTAQNSIVVKLAWMDMSNLPSGLDASDYYTQDLLAFTPGYLNTNGKATCEKTTMGLVGMHLIRKTETQPAWVWGTFEQQSNAPDCTSLPPDGDQNGSGQNTNCPSISANYNFAAQGSSIPSAGCNAVPADNAPGQCKNPQTGDSGWCLDVPPTQLSQLCRQIPVGDYYSGVSSWNDTPPNQACQPAATVWANYQLISTQWNDMDLNSAQCTQNVVTNGQFDSTNDGTAPTVPIGPNGGARPFLANTSMESYERANCMGCHSKSTIEEAANNESTDFVYFLGVEVPEGAVPKSPIGKRRN